PRFALVVQPARSAILVHANPALEQPRLAAARAAQSPGSGEHGEVRHGEVRFAVRIRLLFHEVPPPIDRPNAAECESHSTHGWHKSTVFHYHRRFDPRHE